MNTNEKSKSLRMLIKIRGFREFGIIIFIIIISILIGIRNPRFLTWGNIHDMLLDTAILSILAVGMTLVLVTGGIDLSSESGLALTGMIAGMMIKDNPSFISYIHAVIWDCIGKYIRGDNWFNCIQGEGFPDHRDLEHDVCIPGNYLYYQRGEMDQRL
jgi:ABC-type xylose transport system permease subunit